MRALDQVRAFISAHGASRFELDDNPDQKIFNRAGFKRWDGNEWEYVILSVIWRDEECRGLDARRAARTLNQHGLLVPGEGGRQSAVRRLSKHGTIRGYCIRGCILEESSDE
jgi:putative DNA primase/helicase